VTTYVEHAVALFPGQGAISPGAGRRWRHTESWDLVDLIAEAATCDIANLLLDADLDTVVRTDNAQLATFALSMITWDIAKRRGEVPRYILGHSLGEFSGLVAAGYMSIEDGSRVIAARGRAMAEAAAHVPGSMVALMGPLENAAHDLSAIADVWVANINGTGQLVVSGSTAGLHTLCADPVAVGWKRATPLTVGGAFHSPLMAPARDSLTDVLATVTWTESPHLVIANVDGRLHTSPDDWKNLLVAQLTSPVQFLSATQALPDTVTHTIEMAPGAVLTGLTKRIRPFADQVIMDKEGDS
jgi:[acyl-carrier-protein] S-malonyltransferase